MTLLQKIKESEGFRGEQYLDHLGNPTIGFGTLLPINQEEAELLLQIRLSKMIDELVNHKPFVIYLQEDKQEVLYEMAYQLGVPKLLQFKRMWEALQGKNYEEASKEMLNSKWASQTPNRALKLANIMRKN